MLTQIQKYLFARKANKTCWKNLAHFFHRNRLELTGG